MSDFVLDSSVTLSLFLPSTPRQKAYADAVAKLLADGAVPLVPALYALEVGSVLLKSRRRRLISETKLREALDQIDANFYRTAHMPYTVPGLVDAGARYMLQGYDAVYFDLAKQRGLPLASVDRGHASACKAHGVKLLTF
jgi:predicted nucleic acid-binding protein